MSANKDYNELVDQVRKVVKQIADNNFYREFTHNHRKIIFHYRGKRVRFTFALTPSDRRATVNDRAKVKRKLRALGITNPRIGMKFMTDMDVSDVLLADLYSILDKPYEKQIYYVRNGKEIIYHRYYVSQRRYSGNGRYREGFFPANKQQYVDAVNKHNIEN